MASAGRILIMPKGNYEASATYEMLDLVFYGGTSWIAKKTVVGIEPSETNSEYWHKLCESVDLTEIENRIKALEDEEIDLSNFATKDDLTGVREDLDAVEETAASLTTDVAGIKNIVNNLPTTFSNIEIVTYEGTNTYGADNPTSVTCKTAPRLLIYLGYSSEYGQESATSSGNIYTQNLIICDFLTTEYTLNYGFKEASTTPLGVRYAKKSEDGKTISWYLADSGISNQNQLNSSGRTYYFLAIS